MNTTILDFETYYDSKSKYGLTTLTIPEYVHDPRFHVHGLATRRPDGRTEFRTDVRECLAELQEAFGSEFEQTIIVCHNAMFDLYILNHIYGLRSRFFTDTMLLSYHVHGRPSQGGGESASLSSLANKYGLRSKGDLSFMEGVRHPNAQQQADLADYAKNDVEITAKLVDLLLPKITRPEVELHILMHTVRLFTERSIQIDVNRIGLLEQTCCDQVSAHLESAGVTAKAVSGSKAFTKLLQQALSLSQRSVPMKMGKSGLIPATAKTDQEMQALANDDDPHVMALALARLGQKGLDQKLARLHKLRCITSATGGYLPPYLVYYGSHTGRFAGGGGFNIQNMARTGQGLKIRELLVPRPGNVFIIADLAQIEARITAWLAGEDGMVRDFEQGHDVYSRFASATFGVVVRKPDEDDSPEVHAELGRFRQVGKQAVLGLGFGMGAKKFMQTLQADRQTKSMFDHGELNAARCYQIVTDFRDTYARIRNLWRELEAAVKKAADGVCGTVGPLQIRCDQEDLLLVLPSGRALRYANVRWDFSPQTISYLDDEGVEREFSSDGPGVVYGNNVHLYGGKITENVVQAIARDLLVDAILQVESDGLPVAFHVHDEVIVEVAEAQATAATDTVRQIMCVKPAWALGLPIECETKVSACYGK